ncbi:glycoside hydrolase family 3 C-terminal domain-containing protein [Amycolatopsis methanolica]|uniref:glycoside hydrolase family 3 C-terminal domain-containing protein n=1 Tax=Amycolatopsis methanolica TaxID=1814 RepID=UPI00341B7C29
MKHFAVNSQETDRMRISADIDERTLREMYLRAFQRVVTQARPWTVMCSYNRINGVYASQNRWLLTEVLREEWGFEGLVSDWGAVADRVAAVAAGLDLTMPGPDDTGDRALAEAVADGRLDPAALRAAADRVRALVERATEREPGKFDADAHHALAREIAARAVVLLKNEGGLLPLSESQSLAVIGEFARTALSESAEVRFGSGYDDIDEAVALAAESEVALVFVGSEHETEGADRDSVELPPAHRELVERVAAANPRTVVVLSNGAVVLTRPWEAAVPAIVEGWLLGQAGGSALADVLFGRTNPSGRLAETIRRGSPTTRPTWTSPARTGARATGRACTSATAASTRASRMWPTRPGSGCRTRRSSTAPRRRPSRTPASRSGSR